MTAVASSFMEDLSLITKSESDPCRRKNNEWKKKTRDYKKLALKSNENGSKLFCLFFLRGILNKTIVKRQAVSKKNFRRELLYYIGVWFYVHIMLQLKAVQSSYN